MEIFVGYLSVVNLIAFMFFGLDKKKAIKNKWRIKESVLLSLSLFGGGIGSLLGMKIYHHKTKKTKFIICIPLFTIIFGIAIYYLNTIIKIF